MNIREFLSKSKFLHSIYLWYVGKGISIFKTAYFNFTAFPFSVAIKFPVWVYQGVKIEEVGKITITIPASGGVVRIGKPMFFRGVKTTFINRGHIQFDGNCEIMMGATIHVLRPCSMLVLGKEVMISELVRILCDTTIHIGDYSRIAYGSTLMDSEFHYVLNMEKGEVTSKRKPIKLGNYNWIGNTTIIKKGVITPDYCIVSNGSMLTKDYSDVPRYSILMGVPAKVKSTGFRRVYNDDNDKMLDEFFLTSNVNYSSQNTDKDGYDEDFCGGQISVHVH